MQETNEYNIKSPLQTNKQLKDSDSSMTPEDFTPDYDTLRDDSTGIQSPDTIMQNLNDSFRNHIGRVGIVELPSMEVQSQLSRQFSSISSSSNTISRREQRAAPLPSSYDQPSNRHDAYGETLNKEDIKLGRGGDTNNHPGNQRYRQLVQRLMPAYQRSCSLPRNEKSAFIDEFLQLIRNYGGRFMMENVMSGTYSEIPEEEAKKKIVQCFRDQHSLRRRRRSK